MSVSFVRGGSTWGWWFGSRIFGGEGDLEEV